MIDGANGLGDDVEPLLGSDILDLVRHFCEVCNGFTTVESFESAGFSIVCTLIISSTLTKSVFSLSDYCTVSSKAVHDRI